MLSSKYKFIFSTFIFDRKIIALILGYEYIFFNYKRTILLRWIMKSFENRMILTFSSFEIHYFIYSQLKLAVTVRCDKIKIFPILVEV